MFLFLLSLCRTTPTIGSVLGLKWGRRTNGKRGRSLEKAGARQRVLSTASFVKRLGRPSDRLRVLPLGLVALTRACSAGSGAVARAREPLSHAASHKCFENIQSASCCPPNMPRDAAGARAASGAAERFACDRRNCPRAQPLLSNQYLASCVPTGFCDVHRRNPLEDLAEDDGCLFVFRHSARRIFCYG